MKTLKFRIWDLQQKKYHTDSDWGISLDGKSIIGFSSHDKWNEDRGYKIKLDNLVIEQYTGLLDRDGKEIFDGDIVKYHLGDPSVAWTDLVAWESYGWRTIHFDGLESSSNPLCPLPSMEIIGNIHENPDLLK